MGASRAGASPSKAVTKVATLSRHAFGSREDYTHEDMPQAAHTSTSTRHEAEWDQGSNVTAFGALGVPTTSVSSPEDKLEDKLEYLRRIAIENSSRTSKRTSAPTTGEGNYISHPLETYLDLIRPRPVPGVDGESGAGADGQPAPRVSTGDELTFDDNSRSAIPNVRPHSSYASDAAQLVGTHPQGASEYPPGQHQLFLPSEREHGSKFAASMQPAQRNTKQIPESQRRRRLLQESYQITQSLLETYQAQVAQELQGENQAPDSDAQQVGPEQSHVFCHQQAPPQEPLRPVSPPLMAWDLAVESPPNIAPVSNFPQPPTILMFWISLLHSIEATRRESLCL